MTKSSDNLVKGLTVSLAICINCPSLLSFESSAEILDETKQRSNSRQTCYAVQDESCFLKLRKSLETLFLPSYIWDPCYGSVSWSAISIDIQTWKAATHTPKFCLTFENILDFMPIKHCVGCLPLSADPYILVTVK